MGLAWLFPEYWSIRSIIMGSFLIGSLLRIFAKHDDPASIERAINIIVPAMYIQSMFGERWYYSPPSVEGVMG
jgi:hypothetical protein